MKRKYLYLLGLVLCSQLVSGQVVTIINTITNTDSKTQGKRGQDVLSGGARNVAHGIINGDLKKSVYNFKEYLKAQYTKNAYDKDGFLSVLLSAAATNAFSYLVSNFPFPYMTQAKRAYIRQIALSKAVLLPMKFVSISKIQSSKRQEIYRLRKLVAKSLSRSDGNVRSILFFSGAGLVVTNPELLLELLDKLKGLEFLDVGFQAAHAGIESL